MQLPPDLRAALDMIAGQSTLSDLRAASAVVTARYRGKARVNAGLLNDHEARAYLGARFPATYAAAQSAFGQIMQNRPDFNPRSLLDVGAGPGTVALAALSYWPEIETVKLLEPNLYLRRAGQSLFEELGLADRIEWINAPLQGSDLASHASELVTSGYVLNEIINEDEIERLTEKLWAASLGTLVVIEPGTPEGYAIALCVRSTLLATGAHMVAPCPHVMECPLKNTSAWCHFSARVERSKLHRALKDGATLAYEDEKFSYVALSREQGVLPTHRVIGHPTGSKIVELQLCNADGTATTTLIPKSHPQHKLCRKLEWGDAVDEKLFP